MQENNTTEKLLESHHTPLSSDKKEVLWNTIEADIAKLPIPSPYVFTKVTKKTMTSIALALVLMFSLGGTAYASNDARPGDILFPIDQAFEEIRLALVSNDDSRAQLQIAFAEERLSELRSLLAERNNGQTATSTNTTSSTTTIVTFEAEADVFTNTTIVTVEINDRKTTFETSANTKSAVVDEIVRRYSVDRSRVEQVLDFEIEDRASRVSDIGGSDTDDDRVKTSVALISKLIDESDDNSRDRFISELMQVFGSNNADDDFRFKQDDDEIEFRNDDSRVRMREKDGETRIEIRADDDSDDRSDDDSRSDDDDNGTSQSSFEAEADVFTNTTIVTVEINDRKTTFETSANTKSTVVDEIVRRYSVDRSRVEQVLDFEIEDRASRVSDADDSNSNNDDDSTDRDDDSSTDDSNDDSNDDSDNRIKIEVRVEDGQAEVRMEFDNKRDEFTLVYESTAALIAQLAARSGLTQTLIENNLDLEIND